MIRGGLVTLFVRDVGRAVRFYVETLGMKLVELVLGEKSLYHIVPFLPLALNGLCSRDYPEQGGFPFSIGANQRNLIAMLNGRGCFC